MSEQDELVDRFARDPQLVLRDSKAPTVEELERQLAEHDDYREVEAHPDDDGLVEPVHEEFLGPPAPGVGVGDVDGGEALKRETGR